MYEFMYVCMYVFVCMRVCTYLYFSACVCKHGYMHTRARTHTPYNIHDTYLIENGKHLLGELPVVDVPRPLRLLVQNHHCKLLEVHRPRPVRIHHLEQVLGLLVGERRAQLPDQLLHLVHLQLPTEKHICHICAYVRL